MARRAVEPYSNELEYGEFSIPFHAFSYLDTLEIRERSRMQRIFPSSICNPLNRKSIKEKNVWRINQGFLFSLEKYRSDIFTLYIVSIEEYINFRGKNFYFEKFFVVFDVTVKKIFFFFFFFFSTILIR